MVKDCACSRTAKSGCSYLAQDQRILFGSRSLLHHLLEETSFLAFGSRLSDNLLSTGRDTVMPYAAQNPSVCFQLDLFLCVKSNSGSLFHFFARAEAQLCRVQSSPERLHAMASLHLDGIDSTVNMGMYKYIVNIIVSTHDISVMHDTTIMQY